MKELRSIVIVGAGVAGVRSAEALRARGFSGRIIVVGREQHLPYQRPPLSKDYLRGAVELDGLRLSPGEAWDNLDVDLRVGAEVASISPKQASVTLGNGRELSADCVIVCTGGASRPIDIPGTCLAGVHELRTLDDALVLREALSLQSTVAIIGGGFIGAEVASTASELGNLVTVLEADTTMMRRGLGDRWGRFVEEEHRRRGINVRTGVTVTRIRGNQKCTGVELQSGEVIPAETVLIAVGMTPRCDLAQDAGAEIDSGIVVDKTGSTTVPNLFAAGDAATGPVWRGSGRARFESVENAERQADVAAAGILHQSIPERTAPWFWSDQLNWNIQFAGSLVDSDDVVVRMIDEKALVAFHLLNGVLRGVFAVNRGRDVRAAIRLMESRKAISREILMDMSVDLRKLALDEI